jgi:arylsulfatase A-like enzyme
VRSGVCPALSLRRSTAPRSLVFVLSDTLRRDRLAAYGGAAHTPAFDDFASRNLLFRSASTQAPWTKPSIATLFTGLYPSQHGVVSHPRLRGANDRLESDVLGGDQVTLAEALSAAGYQTAAFVSNPWLQPTLGFAQGFDVYDDSFAANATPGAVVSRAAVRWLEDREDPGRPFFLYLHYMDAHAPYARVSDEALALGRARLETDRRPVTPRARAAIAARARDARGAPLATRQLPPSLAMMELVYDQGVERFDRALSSLMTALESEPSAQGAAMVVAADHGEALFARGWGGHGHGLFEDEVAVPLAMRLPGVTADGDVECPIGLVDLRSSLCDYLGVDCPGADQGHSIFDPAPIGADRAVFSEAVIDRPRHRAVRDARYKLLYEPDGRPAPGSLPARADYAMFDLVEDPEETRDLLAGEPSPDQRAAFERLKEILHSGIAELDRSASESAPLDAATRERLESLGYLDPAAGPSAPLEDE